MTARRLTLAWSAGATCGLVVGFLVGESVRDGAAFRALRRAEPGPGAPQPPSGHSGTVEALNGAQEGAQWLDQDELHARPDYQEALRRAEDMPWEPGVELSEWERKIAKPAADRRFFPLAEVAAEFGVDLDEPPTPSQRDDEPCTHTLGSLTCPFRGAHTSHAYQGIYAPDAKSDADERIE